MLQSKLCSCADRNCFHRDCACFTTEGICSEDCRCRAECKNISDNDKVITKQFAEYTKNKAAAAAADQAAAAQAAAADQAAAATAAAAQAAAQPQPKPLPEKREPGNTSPSAVKTNFVATYGCGCRNNGCKIDRCTCFWRKIRCASKCTCTSKFCVNPFGLRGDESNAQPGGQRGTTGTPDGGTSQTQPSSSAAQAAAQTLPSSSVVAALAPDTKTKPLPAREPGSTQKPCRCDKCKCKNGQCGCVKAGLLCCDRCKCKDCRNTKTGEEKLQDLFEDRGNKREVPASGSGTSTITTRAPLAANESAMGCTCQSKCASRCGCVRRNIKCTSKCRCKFCNKDDGSRFTNKSKAGPGGQGGTLNNSSAVESVGKHG